MIIQASFQRLNKEYEGIKFDFICLHGVWSDFEKNRNRILHFIENNLEIGGILYISYNCKPGWASMLPYRDAMLNYAASNIPSGVTGISRTKGAIDFGKRLSETSPLYLKQNPVAQKSFRFGYRRFELYLA